MAFEPHRPAHDAPVAPTAPAAGAPPALPATHDGIDLVAWPAEAARRGLLAAEGRPRLLLVEPDAPPPVCWDDQEDWLRLPAEPTELTVRVATLRRRASGPGADEGPSVPVLDADGLLRHGDDWVAIPPIEARLLAQVLNAPGAVVPRSDLVAAGWPHGTSDDRILDGRMKLLRRRIARFGLRIHTVRGVGFLLEPGD